MTIREMVREFCVIADYEYDLTFEFFKRGLLDKKKIRDLVLFENYLKLRSDETEDIIDRNMAYQLSEEFKLESKSVQRIVREQFKIRRMIKKFCEIGGDDFEMTYKFHKRGLLDKKKVRDKVLYNEYIEMKNKVDEKVFNKQILPNLCKSFNLNPRSLKRIVLEHQRELDL